MPVFFEIKSLTEAEAEALAATVADRIAAKLKDGTFTEREVREIEEMRLRPIPDILDVQSVYEDFLFRRRG
jgi:hypothetical protein